MKLRASFFNTAILRKNLVRCIPVVAIYTLIWFLILPAGYIQGHHYYSGDFNRSFYVFSDIVGRLDVASVGNMLYCGLLSMVLFGYLFNSRSANMMHAFPIRREGLFLTALVSGLLCCLVPNLLTAVLTLLAVGSIGVRAVGCWYLMMTLQTLFFFGFACFIAQLVSHILALPIVYGILNFAVVVLEAILREMLQCCLLGLGGFNSVLSPFSPVYHIIMSGRHITDLYNRIPQGYAYLTYHWIIGGVGVLFLIGALLLYRIRRVESAGDVIAIPALRPVFKYSMTAGCAVVLGYVISLLLGFDYYYGNEIGMFGYLLVGAFIGYFGSEMALKKRINVFKKEWIGFGISLVVIIALLGLCRLDVFGFSSYVPNEDAIRGVRLDYSFDDESNAYSENPEMISAVRSIHAQIAQEHTALTREYYGGSTYAVHYKLKNGRTVNRYYRLELTSNPSDPDYEFSKQMDAVFCSPELQVLRNCPADPLTRQNLTRASAEYCINEDEYYYGTIDLLPNDAIDLYNNCILPDILDGTVFFDTILDNTAEEYASFVKEGKPNRNNTQPESFGVYLDVKGSPYSRCYYYRITPSAKRSYAALLPYWEQNRE